MKEYYKVEKQQLIKLLEAYDSLGALECAGVDNWNSVYQCKVDCGYDEEDIEFDVEKELKKYEKL